MNEGETVNMWDQRFAQDAYVYGREPNEFLKKSCRELKTGRVLCLADGEGRNGVYLAEQGHAVTSVDASSVGLDKANKLASERGVKINTIIADLEDFNIECEDWDAIVSIFFHLSIPVRRILHKKVVRGLRPGGVFILEAYTPDQIEFGTGGPRTTDLLMNLDALKSELNGLVFDHAQEIKREIIEGTLHTGMSAVVQVVASKPRVE